MSKAVAKWKDLRPRRLNACENVVQFPGFKPNAPAPASLRDPFLKQGYGNYIYRNYLIANNTARKERCKTINGLRIEIGAYTKIWI